jgi:hypothetical protein
MNLSAYPMDLSLRRLAPVLYKAVPFMQRTTDTMPFQFNRLLLAAGLIYFLCRATVALGQADTFERDLRTIAGHPSRVVGSAGYVQTVDYIRSELAKLSNVEVREHAFDVMMPVTSQSSLTLADGRELSVAPFWPAHARLSATPADGIRGRLVYIGNAEYADITPSLLRGQIAVVEPIAAGRWARAFYFGARAVVVLPSNDLNNVDLRTFDVRVQANLPRFYLNDVAFADQIRRDKVVEGVTLTCQVDWKSVQARNIYALIQPAAGASPIGNKPAAAVTISVPIESSGLVPDLSSGASQAVNTAAGLSLARQVANAGIDRPVMLAFTGADTMTMQGSRQMFLALAEAPSTWRREIQALQSDRDAAKAQASRLMTLVDAPWALSVEDRDINRRIVKLIETDIALEQDVLFKLRLKPADQMTRTDRDKLAALDARQADLARLRGDYINDPKLLDAEGKRDMARDYANRALIRLVGGPDSTGLLADQDKRLASLKARVSLYEWLADRLKRDRDPNERNTENRLIEVQIGIDLSDGGVRVCPLFQGAFGAASARREMQSYGEVMQSIRRDFQANQPHAAWWKDVADVIDLETLSTARQVNSYVANLPLPSEMATSFAVPGFSFVTADDFRHRRDTPNDTLDRLNLHAVRVQFDALSTLLLNVVARPQFVYNSEGRRERNGFVGQVVSAAAGKPVPDLPRPGFLVGYQHVANTARIPGLRFLPYAVGLRRSEFIGCDAEGRYQFEGLSRTFAHEFLQVQVYQFEPGSGRIVATSDLGKQSADISPFARLRQSINPLRSIPFFCDEFSLVQLYDPRFLQGLGEVQMMDARRNADMQKFNVAIYDRMMAGFIEPGARGYLLFRYGQIGNRLVLLNMPDEKPSASMSAEEERFAKLGRGLSIDQILNLDPLALETGRDFSRLSGKRLDDYRSAGVSSRLIDELQAESTAMLASAEKAMKSGTADTVVRDANGAWASQALVYAASKSMANDVVRAAIFLLLLAVPFSVCMERLLLASPSVYKQIAGVSGIFAVMTLALFLFHPAFKISASPLIIILAFAIIFMSIIVISVIYQKFDGELKKIRSGRGTSEGANFMRASVLTSAVMLGIANMRKRKIRTALTATTIILITFAVLVFASATSYRSTTSLPAGVASDHPGVQLRQRGFRPMPADVVSELRVALPGRTFIERWWNVSAADPNEQNLLIAGGESVDGLPPRVVALPAVLGLSPGESTVSQVEDVIGPSFARLEAGETNIVYLGTETAEQLKVKPGDTIRAGGLALEVAGLFNTADFDRKVLSLSGEPITPLKYELNALDAGGRRLNDGAAESLSLDANSSAAELQSVYQHLPANQIAIVPAPVCRLLHNARLASVNWRLPDFKSVDADADEVVRRFTLVTFAGKEDGVQMLAANNLSKITGSQVAIPLLIGGLIIFNTMMGSIAERKREIHIYTSLGLAPLHVGALFVAEALTYGVIGTVFGYIIGQGVGTLFLKLGWLGNMTLDYSGTSALLTIGLILLVVLLSALVPARLASKIAAPSIERSWKVPLPKDGQITATLPFTINRTAAEGVVAYLAEFFDAHREGSIGKFASDDVKAFAWSGDEAESHGKPSRGLQTTIWLTPFDLGVRQHLMLLVHPGEFPDIYEVQVLLSRLSGDDGSWYRMNKPFLTELRKQFLQWRSLSPQRMREYVDASRKLFGDPRGAEKRPGVAANEAF